MTTQINIRLSDSMLAQARRHSEKNGFDNIQDFFRETIREKLHPEPDLTPKEFELIKRLKKLADERNLYASEEELFKKLRS